MEAASGLEPENEGFAGLCLTNLAMPPPNRAFYAPRSYLSIAPVHAGHPSRRDLSFPTVPRLTVFRHAPS